MSMKHYSDTYISKIFFSLVFAQHLRMHKQKVMDTFEFCNFACTAHSALLDRSHRTHRKKGCAAEPTLLKQSRITENNV